MTSIRDHILVYLNTLDDRTLRDTREGRKNCVALISNALAIPRPSVTGALRALQEDGLIDRELHHKSTVSVWLTEAGISRAISAQEKIDKKRANNKPKKQASSKTKPKKKETPLQLHDQPTVVGAFIQEGGSYEYILQHNDRRILVSEVTA